MGEARNAYYEEKVASGTSRRKRGDDIKINYNMKL